MKDIEYTVLRSFPLFYSVPALIRESSLFCVDFVGSSRIFTEKITECSRRAAFCALCETVGHRYARAYRPCTLDLNYFRCNAAIVPATSSFEHAAMDRAHGRFFIDRLSPLVAAEWYHCRRIGVEDEISRNVHLLYYSPRSCDTEL